MIPIAMARRLSKSKMRSGYDEMASTLTDTTGKVYTIWLLPLLTKYLKVESNWLRLTGKYWLAFFSTFHGFTGRKIAGHVIEETCRVLASKDLYHEEKSGVSKELVLHYVRDHNVQISFRQSAQ